MQVMHGAITCPEDAVNTSMVVPGFLPLACISTIHGGHVGNADYTGAIICLTQTPDINHLVKILVISQ